MSLVPVLELMSDARRRGLGLVALNVILLEHAEAIVEAAEDCELPTVLQVSENTVDYHQGRIRPRAYPVASGDHCM
jgi:fructose-bisphosphate aldolase, class II